MWWIPFAAVSLPFLLLFRLTCYYYRGAYYRSVWQSPTACAVAEPHVHYTGETRFPLIIQNTHRYFFYIAGIISVINTYDAIMAFHSNGPGFRIRPGQRHSRRQRLCCGSTRCPATPAATSPADGSSTSPSTPCGTGCGRRSASLNTRHKQFAWITLGTLMLTDFYIMLVASGTITDLRFVG